MDESEKIVRALRLCINAGKGFNCHVCPFHMQRRGALHCHDVLMQIAADRLEQLTGGGKERAANG